MATALCGTVQAVAGGQPLLIVGVAEPIVLTYKVAPQVALSTNVFSSLHSAIDLQCGHSPAHLEARVNSTQSMLLRHDPECWIAVSQFMYNFAKGRPDLGPALFLPWASWVLVWAALMILVLALTGACTYTNQFTRFSGELFGGLIAVLFLQQAVEVGQLTVATLCQRMMPCPH